MAVDRRPHCPNCGAELHEGLVEAMLARVARSDDGRGFTRREREARRADDLRRVSVQCVGCHEFVSLVATAQVEVIVNVTLAAYDLDHEAPESRTNRKWRVDSVKEGIKVNGVLFAREYPKADVDEFWERRHKTKGSYLYRVGSDEARMVEEEDGGMLCRCGHALMRHYDGHEAGKGGCEYEVESNDGDFQGTQHCVCKLTRLEVLAQHKPLHQDRPRSEAKLEVFG